MKFQVVSDLHLEYTRGQFSSDPGISPHPDADALILAGNVGKGALVLEYFRHWPVPCFFVPGNQDYYGQDLGRYPQELAKLAEGSAVHVLEKSMFLLGPVRILGVTLWTDFELNHPQVPVAHAMLYAQRNIVDYQNVLHEGRLIDSLDIWGANRDAKHWLSVELAKRHAGPTLVVSHHAPHPLSIAPRFAHSRALNPALCSNLERLLHKADCWVHGHTYDSFNYEVGGCKVVANPRGYPLELRHAQRLVDGVFENPGFRPDLMITL